MKKSDLALLFSLTVLTVAGIWGINWSIENQKQADALSYSLTLDALSYSSTLPVLSAESGFYDESFTLYITAPENSQVYYTLDGSVPTTNSFLYTEPLIITAGMGRESNETRVINMQLDWMNCADETHYNNAAIIRAVAIDENGNSSDIVTATYILGMEEYKEILVISIVADPEDLFGDNGIYVTGKDYDEWYLSGQEGPAPTPNFLQHGEEWERPAVIELFEGGVSFLQQPAGIRIQGASARYGQQKRFSVYSRKKYSESGWFSVPIFGARRTHSFVLRSGFMNGYLQHLVQDRDVASAESREIVVFLNGALWYVTIAQEKYSGKYFQEKYGIDDDNVIIAKDGEVESGDAEDQALYQAIYDFINTHDMSDAASYEQFDRIIDIQSYIDFSCVNVYFANLDYSERKNYVCWRSRKTEYGEYTDGRWRWALYDMDLLNGNYDVRIEEVNTFTTDTYYAGAAFNTRPLYAALKQNELFCQNFVLSFMDMVNTDFTIERARTAMEEWDITPSRWGMSVEWVESYFPARTEAVICHLAEEFGLTGTCETLRLSINDAEAGYIILNTIRPELSEDEWSGIYFTDYPVTVTAVANSGYVFEGWQSNNISGELLKDAEMTLELPEGGLTLQAIFKKK